MNGTGRRLSLRPPRFISRADAELASAAAADPDFNSEVGAR